MFFANHSSRSSRSFGYDCRRRGNLHVLDNKTVMFVAGSVVELIDLSTGQHRYIPTVGGYSIGTLVVRRSMRSNQRREEKHRFHSGSSK